MKPITVKQIMSWEPCDDYHEERVKELIGKGKTPLEILDLDIPAADRLWVVLREGVIPKIELHLLACQFAEDVLKAERKAGREPHRDSWNAIKVKRQWCEGEATNEEKAAASDVAWDAASDVAWDAARTAQIKHIKNCLRG